MSTCCLTVKTNRNPQQNLKYRSRLRSPGGSQVVLSPLTSVSLLLVRISLLSFTSFSLCFISKILTSFILYLNRNGTKNGQQISKTKIKWAKQDYYIF